MALSSVNAGEGTDKKFPQFDVVNDESDHSYINWNKPTTATTTTTTDKGKASNGPDCFSNASSGVHKKIMKEWKVLEKNLPENIYVRVYESRIDLLRAAIVGPAGTPYHDGLFVFDLAFPPDYPARPPHVHYRSFGLRINPNLYANGMVCLSLLNTWFGKNNEKWNPAESTVLQILVSIQGLVLNREPYFNEPGVGLFPGRAKKSRVYSEHAFVLSCKTMVYLLRRPPKNFEALVTSHFREQASHILAACHEYVNGGVRVGGYTVDGLDSVTSKIKVSKDFKALMVAWYPEMVVAFRRTGASLGNFSQQLGVEKKTSSSETVKKTATSPNEITSNKKEKTKAGGIGKLVGKLKKILGLGKKGIKVNSSS